LANLVQFKPKNVVHFFYFCHVFNFITF